MKAIPLSDESPPMCIEGELSCPYKKCIREEFKCDGDNDCGDWTDEYGCNIATRICNEDEFKCNDGKCIPIQFRCDKQKDCEENEDETGCDPSMIKTCGPDEYTCSDGACILVTLLK